eukprot:scaffold264882_cov21-Tisochrysis_lutea.AAC.1
MPPNALALRASVRSLFSAHSLLAAGTAAANVLYFFASSWRAQREVAPYTLPPPTRRIAKRFSPLLYFRGFRLAERPASQ